MGIYKTNQIYHDVKHISVYILAIFWRIKLDFGSLFLQVITAVFNIFQ